MVMELHARIEQVLGWPEGSARSFSLASLRELVRKSPKLSHELTQQIRTGDVISRGSFDLKGRC